MQRYDPQWASTVVEYDGAAGQVHVHLEVEERAHPVFAATSTFRLGEQSWVQRFRVRVVDDEEMRAAPWIRQISSWTRAHIPVGGRYAFVSSSEVVVVSPPVVFVLVHSPIVGSDTREPVAQELRARDAAVVVPTLTDDGAEPFWRQRSRP